MIYELPLRFGSEDRASAGAFGEIILLEELSIGAVVRPSRPVSSSAVSPCRLLLLVTAGIFRGRFR